MPRLYDVYKDVKTWDEGLPSDLIPPIKHLRKAFDKNHFVYGQITGKLCYWQLHPDEASLDINEYLKPLQQLKGIVGVQATQLFVERLLMATAPAFFKAFFDLYLEGMTKSALAIFFELMPIGKAHEHRLGVPHLQWAEAQTKKMIRYNINSIDIWIRDVCDKHSHRPDEDDEEQLFWSKWQAPMLISMKPSLHAEYDSAKSWERLDSKRSMGLRQALSEHYVLYVETRLEKAAGQAALELAKQPQPLPVAPSPQQDLSRGERQTPKVRITQQESRQKATQAKYRSWQVKYRSLKKSYPDRTDGWYARKIAALPVAAGSSPDTIRKQMKKK